MISVGNRNRIEPLPPRIEHSIAGIEISDFKFDVAMKNQQRLSNIELDFFDRCFVT